MNDRFAEVLECYDFNVRAMNRARGAFMLETDQGLKLLKCLSGSEKKLLLENELTAYLSQSSFRYVDNLVKNKEDMLVTTDNSGDRYIVKNWFRGNECCPRDKDDIMEGARTMGQLHSCLEKCSLSEEWNDAKTVDIKALLEKHTRELKRVKAYIRNKKKKNEFEVSIIDCFDMFYQRAEYAINTLEESMYDKRQIIHGSYTYHNILRSEKCTAVVNFDKAGYGSKVLDLYYYLRKVMEKNNWKTSLGEGILNEYDRQCKMEDSDWKLLGIMLAYPEKYWKIVNHYYNNKKCWTANKNIEKLDSIREQEWQKTLFLQKVFSLSF